MSDIESKIKKIVKQCAIDSQKSAFVTPIVQKHTASLLGLIKEERESIKCQSCGEPISRDCLRCQKLWES